MARWLGVGIVPILLLAGLLAGSFAAGRAEAQNPVPIVVVKLDQASQEANVAPGQSGIVTFTGSCEVRALGVERVAVSLTAAAGGWATAVSPSSMVFQGSGEQAFTLSVRAPPFTSFTVAQNVEVTGTWVGAGAMTGKVQAATGSVYIKQYFKMSIECSKPYIEIGPADSVPFELKVWNEGNAKDTFKFDIVNLKDLAKKGFSVQLSRNRIEVEEKGYGRITITVNTPKNWEIWENEVNTIQISVESEGALGVGTKLMDVYPVYTWEHGMHIPGFEATSALAIIAAIVLLALARRRV